MDTSQAALILLFGLTWANAISSIGEYRAFDTAEILRLRSGSLRALARFLVANVICNVLPIALLYYFYTYVFAADHNDPQNTGLPITPWRLVAAVVASLSVFSVPRLLHALTATKTLSWFFYDCTVRDGQDKSEFQSLIHESKQDENDCCCVHLIPGLAYVFGTIWAAHYFVK